MADQDFKELIEYKEHDTLVTEVLNRMKSLGSKITNFNNYGVFRNIVNAICWPAAQLYDLLLEVVPGGFASTAKGKWLDKKAAENSTTRKEAVKTQGTILLGRDAAGSNVNIRTGDIVKTEIMLDGSELRYFITEDLVLADPALEISGPVQAEFAGLKYNVGENKITKMVTYIPGIDYVRNGADWITREGSDEEEDESLRERYFLKWEEASQGGTDGAFASWARSVAGVEDAYVDANQPRGEFTVDVVISSTTGIPTSTLIDEVQAAIEANKPNVVDVIAKGPIERLVNLEVTLTLPADQGDILTTQAEAEAQFSAKFQKNSNYENIKPYRISESFYLASIVSIGMGISPVLNTVVTTPAADIAANPGELLTLGTLTVNVVRVS